MVPMCTARPCAVKVPFRLSASANRDIQRHAAPGEHSRLFGPCSVGRAHIRPARTGTDPPKLRLRQQTAAMVASIGKIASSVHRVGHFEKDGRDAKDGVSPSISSGLDSPLPDLGRSTDVVGRGIKAFEMCAQSTAH